MSPVMMRLLGDRTTIGRERVVGFMRRPPKAVAKPQGNLEIHPARGGDIDPNEEWYTPREVFEALRLTFDLDPCHPIDPLPWIPARRTFCRLQDGLMQPWGGLVWLNAPYGAATQAWMRRLVEHGNGVGLFNARTDTYWFHEAVVRASAICFVKGRIRFVDREERELGSRRPRFASMLIGFGEKAGAAVRGCGLGWVP